MGIDSSRLRKHMGTVRKVVADMLRKKGTDLLRDRERFLEAICTAIGEDTAEARLLRVGCDETFLGVFSDAMVDGTSEALEGALVQAAKHLEDWYVLNPDVAMRVSSGIAEGCGDALGVELRPSAIATKGKTKFDNPASHRRKTAFITVALVALAMSAILVFAHFEPVFGSTLLPAKATVNGVEFERYVVRGLDGVKECVFLVDNYGNGRLSLTLRSGVKAHTTSPKLFRDNKGVIFTDANAKTNDFVMQEFSSNQYVPTKLSWTILDDDGTKVLAIASEERHRVSLARRGAIILVVRGPLLKTCIIPTDGKSLDYGLTTFKLESQEEGGQSPIELASDPYCELFLFGRMIARSDT